jgi:hypothetical protein
VGVTATVAVGITVAISWYGALSQEPSRIECGRPIGPWPYPVPSDWPAEPNRYSLFTGDGAFSVLHSSCSIDAAVKSDDYPKLLATAEYHQVVRRSGWPFLALASLHNGQSAPAPTWNGLSIRWTAGWRSGIPIGPDRLNPILPGRALGVLILPFGFVVDSALWFGLLMAAPIALAVRRARRRRAGRCVSCGHNLAPHQLVCPECGVPLAAS